ncbi:hypothetical protein SETIT_6G011400v2 [Setaria italica]|uniref:Acetyltransferase n=1 Tax=Setaria italica TaxID=4555 RepID=A0A368RIK7_SETIT|nr:hypothetical protein SETIT_6G011400v2 [Setaria italica]
MPAVTVPPAVVMPAGRAKPGCGATSPKPETVHLTPWDLQMLTVDHIQKGVRPPGAGGGDDRLVEHLASSFARALARFHPFAGWPPRRRGEWRPRRRRVHLRHRLVALHRRRRRVRARRRGAGRHRGRRRGASLRPTRGLVGRSSNSTDWSARTPRRRTGSRRPVLGGLARAQVTELSLADGAFVAMSLNHGVADGDAFWQFFSTWSRISQSIIGAAGRRTRNAVVRCTGDGNRRRGPGRQQAWVDGVAGRIGGDVAPGPQVSRTWQGVVAPGGGDRELAAARHFFELYSAASLSARPSPVPLLSPSLFLFPLSITRLPRSLDPPALLLHASPPLPIHSPLAGGEEQRRGEVDGGNGTGGQGGRSSGAGGRGGRSGGAGGQGMT